MSSKKRKKTKPAIFDSIRKPLAPPAKKLGDEKPEPKIHPAQRKVKHKKKIEEDGDI